MTWSLALGLEAGRRLLADGVLGNERLDNGDNLFLVVAWKPGDGIENLFGFTNRASAALLFYVAPQELIGGHAQDFCQVRKLLRSQRDRLPFPPTQNALTNAELVGEFALGHAGRFAGRCQVFAELRPFSICRSAHLRSSRSSRVSP